MAWSVSIQEAGRRLGAHPNAVRGWLKSGELRSLSPDDVEGLRARIYADATAAERTGERDA